MMSDSEYERLKEEGSRRVCNCRWIMAILGIAAAVFWYGWLDERGNTTACRCHHLYRIRLRLFSAGTIASQAPIDAGSLAGQDRRTQGPTQGKGRLMGDDKELGLNMASTVCFTGHRPEALGGYDETTGINVEVRKFLAEAVTLAILKGYKTFISGGALGVDQWAAEECPEAEAGLGDRPAVRDLRRELAGELADEAGRYQARGQDCPRRLPRAVRQLEMYGTE